MFAGGLVPPHFDTFGSKGTEALPATSDSGDTWTKVNNGGTGAGLSVVAGQLTNTSSGVGTVAGYAEMNLGATVTRIGFDVTFSAGAVTGSADMAIWATDLAASFPTIPDSGCHFALQPNLWIFGYWQANAFHQLATGNFATALTQDGVTKYRCEINIIGNTAYLLLPDGTTQHVTDAHIASIIGNFASFEIFQNNPSTETRAGIVNLWAETTPAASDRHPYATESDLTYLVETHRLNTDRIWIPVGGLSVWTGQTSPALGSPGGTVEAWLYANAVSAYLMLNVRVPDTWSAVDITIFWVNNGAGAGNVKWDYLAKTFAIGANLTGAPQDFATTVAASAQNLLASTKLTAAAGAFPCVPGSLLTIRIERDGANAADTLANGVGLLGILLQSSP